MRTLPLPLRAASLALVTSFAAAAAATGAESRVDYTIDARLDEVTHFVHGRIEIRLENRTNRALEELWFHAYLNAFASERTLFLRKAGGRSGRYLGRPGRLVVSRLESDRSPNFDLWAGAASDDPDDATDLRVPLPSPLPPGETLVLRGEFVAELPEIVERSGFSGDFHLVAQWFPKLAKLERDGRFVHFPYHPYAEFYANYGTYEVTLDVPRGYVVGGTGTLDLVEDRKARQLYRATISEAHDFAWTAWPGFDEARFSVDGVDVRVLASRAELAPDGELLKTARGALSYFSERYGRYPYPSLTIASPPRSATRAQGMEYPTFITTGAPTKYEWLGVRLTALLTAHELGHQWFYGIVGTNEHDAPFLDEGLTSYAEWRYLERVHPNSGALSFAGLRVSRPAAGRLSTFPLPGADRIDAPASAYSSFSALSRYVYGLTPLTLSTLERLYGADRVDRALATYVEKNRFSHPGKEEFAEALESELGSDARLLFTRLAALPGGYRRSLTASYSPSSRELTVEIHENEHLGVPVEVEIEFVDGRRTRQFLSRKDAGHPLRLPSAPRVVTLDPDRKILIDDRFTDNRVRFDAPRPPARATLRALRLVEALRRLLS